MTRAIPAAVFLTLVSGGLITGCTRPTDPATMATVEQMIQQTDSLRTALNGMDTTALRHMQALFEAERPGIERRFKDTLREREAEVLGNYYRAMAERLPRLLADRRKEQERSGSTLLRLRDLRHDLAHGLLKKKEQQQALEMEKTWNSFLRNHLDRISADSQQLINDRRSYRAAIDSLFHQ